MSIKEIAKKFAQLVKIPEEDDELPDTLDIRRTRDDIPETLRSPTFNDRSEPQISGVYDINLLDDLVVKTQALLDDVLDKAQANKFKSVLVLMDQISDNIDQIDSLVIQKLK